MAHIYINREIDPFFAACVGDAFAVFVKQKNLRLADTGHNDSRAVPAVPAARR